MNLLNCGMRHAVAVLALLFVVPASAQENLDLGKTPAQLFASNCAICHKSPQNLAKSGGLFGLESFLREHYTASRESAAAISKYLQAVDAAPSAPAKRAKRTATGSDRPKDGGKKKPADANSSDIKSPDKVSTEPKSGDAKPVENKPAESKPAEKKTGDVESEPKSGSKSEAKSETNSEAKSEAKPDKSN